MGIMFKPEHQTHWTSIDSQLRELLNLEAKGELQWFLNIHIVKGSDQQSRYLSQQAYIEELQERFHVKVLQKADTPFPPSLNISQVVKNEDQATHDQITEYQKIVGSLLYAAIITRPDISFTVSLLSRFLRNPSEQHFTIARHCLDYLVSTKSLSLHYDASYSGPELQVFSDAAFADDPDDRKSSDGYLVLLFGCPVLWQARKQATVSTSSTEAEFIALTRTTKEAIALYRLLGDLTLRLDLDQIPILCDNRQAIRLVQPNAGRWATNIKHVDIYHHWLRQVVADGQVSVSWTPTAHMAADGFTKPLRRQKHDEFVRMLGLQPSPEEPD